MYESIIRTPDYIQVYDTKGADMPADVGVQAKVNEASKALEVFVTAEETEITFVRLRWNLKEAPKGEVLGDQWERGYGDMGWKKQNPSYGYPWYFYIKNESEMAGYGVKVRPNALCLWQMDPRGITLWLDMRNGGDGVLLKGRTVLAAEVVCANYSMEEISSFHAARDFCTRMCQDPIFPPHAVYGANNWYYAYGHSSREEILADTDYLMSMVADVENPPYMVIDDCWQLQRSDQYIGGPWISNEKFGDMPSLIGAIKDKGARPGIWMRFLYDNREEIPEEWRLATGFLDPSHPGVLNQIEEDIQRICGWGVELIKHDFTTFDIFGRWGFQMNPWMTGDGWHFHDRTKTTAEIVKELYRRILEAAKPTGTLILGCNTIGHLGAGLMHMNRSGDDTSGRVWERSLRMGVNTLAFRLPQHRTFYDIDADCVGIMETLPWKQNRLWAKLLAKSGTSLFVSAKPGVLKVEEKAELAECLRENSVQDEIIEPLDWEEKVFPEEWKWGEEQLHFPWDYGIGLIGLQGQTSFDFDYLFKMTDNRW